MSLRTLPAVVSPKTMVMSPVINVVLFTTETQLLLCRRSGQRVWATRLPHHHSKPEQVSSVSWSPDGKFLAALFESGALVVYDGTTGRPLPIEQSQADAGVASIAWIHKSRINEEANPVQAMVDDLTMEGGSADATNMLAAIGTRDGKLRIRVQGALDIDDLSTGTSNSELYLIASDDAQNEFAVVQDTKVHGFRFSRDDRVSSEDSTECVNGPAQPVKLFSFRPEENISRCCATAVHLLSGMSRDVNSINATIDSIAKHKELFLRPFYSDNTNRGSTDMEEALRDELLESVIWGTVNDSLKNLIVTQHEQGFKKWYKAMTQSWDELVKTLTEDLLDESHRLLVVWRQLLCDSTAIESFHNSLLDLIELVLPLNDAFERQAAYLEYLFREEIDRPIAVTKYSTVELRDTGELLLEQSELLGGLSKTASSELEGMVRAASDELQDVVTQVRVTLRRNVHHVYSTNLGAKATAIKYSSTGSHSYTVILENGTMKTVSENGEVTESRVLAGSNAKFLNTQHSTVSVDPSNRRLFLPGGETKALDFEPVAVSARSDEHQTVVCILAKDCRHYAVIDI